MGMGFEESFGLFHESNGMFLTGDGWGSISEQGMKALFDRANALVVRRGGGNFIPIILLCSHRRHGGLTSRNS